MGSCSIDGCARQAHGHGLCQTHYMRQRRTGSPLTVRPPGIPGETRKHRMYGAWAGMVNRCHNPNNSSYASYGARGVTVCDRWRTGEGGLSGFSCFLADMGERPEGKTLDRINSLGPYEPGNCRWATAKEQRANLTVDGDQRTRLAAAEAKRDFWARRRPGHLTPLGIAIRVIAKERGESLSQLARRYGYASSGYLTGVSFGHKQCSVRLQAAVEADLRFAPEHMRDEANVLDFTSIKARKG